MYNQDYQEITTIHGQELNKDEITLQELFDLGYFEEEEYTIDPEMED